MELDEIKRTLLAHVLHPNYRPVKPRVIAKKLGQTEDLAEFKRALRQLIKEGRVAYGANHLVAPPGAPQGQQGQQQITGVFRRTAAGHGFVRPAGVLPGHEKTDDVYIPANRALDAASGDTVLVRLR